MTKHLPTNGKDTRRILNKAHQVIDFPHSASGRMKYLLLDYLGVNKKMVSILGSRTLGGVVFSTRDRFAKPFGR